jgi:hypothetical protein
MSLPNDETSEDVRLPEMAARRDSEQRVRPKENYHTLALRESKDADRTAHREDYSSASAKTCNHISHLSWYLTSVSATF